MIRTHLRTSRKIDTSIAGVPNPTLGNSEAHS